MKRIRRKLIDVNGRDFFTGEIVNEKYEVEQAKNADKRISEWLKNKIKESKVEWKIFVEWLGRVNA